MCLEAERSGCGIQAHTQGLLVCSLGSARHGLSVRGRGRQPRLDLWVAPWGPGRDNLNPRVRAVGAFTV